MIVTLTGENSFGLGRELQGLIQAFIEKHDDLGLERLDGEEVTFEKIREAVTSLPFLADRKLIILRAPSTNKNFTEQFEHLVEEIPETTDVILVEPKLDKRLGYYKYLKSKTHFRDFPELDQNELTSWLVDTAKEQGGTLSSADARYLIERVTARQQLLSNELDKLLLYDPKISRQTIDLLTDEAPQSTIFQLLEAAFAGNTRRALQLYAEQRALKVEPAQIISMLTWQLHVLAIIKTAGSRSADIIARDARINPFVVRKSQTIAGNLTLPNLKLLISNLLEIDTKSKRTSINIDEALQNYLLQLSN